MTDTWFVLVASFVSALNAVVAAFCTVRMFFRRGAERYIRGALAFGYAWPLAFAQWNLANHPAQVTIRAYVTWVATGVAFAFALAAYLVERKERAASA